MNEKKTFLTISAVLFTTAALAQSYSIDWHSIDNGGGTSTGGGYSMTASISPPDAGEMSGGGFTMDGGFSGVIADDAPPATLTWTNTAAGNWNTAANWSPNQVPRAVDHVIINSGSVTIPADSAFAVMDWTAGSINGALTVASNGVLNLSGSGGKELYAAVTNANGGTINWSGTGFLRLWNNNTATYQGSINNLAGGLFNLQNDQALSCACLGAEYFNNAGTLRKTAGSGTATISVVFTNTGAVEAVLGTISFNSGGTLGGQFTTAGGAVRFAGGEFVLNGPPGFSGDVRFTGGNIHYTVPITNFELSGGTLVGTNLVTGTLNWTAGAINGPLTVASNAVLNLSGSSGKELYAAVTNANGGTINWSGTGYLRLWNNNTATYQGSINNLAGGLFNLQNDQSLSCACLGSEYFSNAGTLRKSAGAGTTTVGVAFNNTGTVDAQSGTIAFSGGGNLGGTFATVAGAAINLSGGSFTEVGVPVFSGGGPSQMTGGSLTLTTDAIAGLTLAGGNLYVSPTFQGGSITNLTVAGANLQGTNTVTGTMNWAAGAINGVLTVASNGVLNLSGSGGKELYAAVTNANGGTINWSGTGFLRLWNNNTATYQGSINNLAGGLFNLQNDQALSCACLGAEYFNNAGTLRKTAGSGTATISVVFTNTGAVEAVLGTISFNSGGTLGGQFTTAGGAVRFAGGEFVLNGPPGFSGDVRFTGGNIHYTVPITNFELSGGTLVGTNLVTGTLNWTAGAINGPLTVASNAVLNLSGSSGKELYAAVTNANGGTINWSGTGYLRLWNNNTATYQGSINNLAGGLFNLQNDQSLSCACLGSEYFSNAGTLRKSAGAGTTTIQSIAFVNQPTGLIQADIGILQLPTPITNSAGILRLNGGTIQSSGTYGMTDGTLEGDGVFGANAITGGLVSPGQAGSGILRFNSGLNLSPNATVTLSGTGTIPGSQYDQLSVTGAVALGSCTLQVPSLPAVPAGTTFILVLNDGTDAVSGTFSGLPENSVMNVSGQLFRIHYGGGTGNDVTLVRDSGSASTGPQLSNSLYTNGNFRLFGAGSNGVIYTIQATTNLIQWTNVGFATGDLSGNINFIDSNAFKFPYRFYRTTQ